MDNAKESGAALKRIVFIFLAVSIRLINAVSAEVPTTSDLRAYQAFKGRHDEKGITGIPAKMADDKCFPEHVCAAEGTIGLSLDCERDLNLCLYTLKTEGVSSDPRSLYARNCAPLFKAMTPAQNAMIASPIGCEVPPPASALQPTMTPGEAQCMADKFCTESHLPAGYEELCRKDYDACTRPLTEMDAFGRALCRGKRVLGLVGQTPRLSPNGPCPPEMPNPVLATVPGTTITSAPTRSQLRTWQEQVAQESGAKPGEFDLGDLDF